MDPRWLLIVAVVMGITGFLLGRRTSPGGRAVHRLQREIDARQQALSRHQDETSRFVADMQKELEHVSGAYRELQAKLKLGAEQLGSHRLLAAVPALAPVVKNEPPISKPRSAEPVTMEWPSRLPDWADAGGGPSMASAAACPLPEQVVLEAPKDYPASRRGHFDEHSYA